MLDLASPPAIRIATISHPKANAALTAATPVRFLLRATFGDAPPPPAAAPRGAAPPQPPPRPQPRPQQPHPHREPQQP
eukprot:gene2983-9579_t